MEFSEVKYQDPATETYLGSPSIIRLENGELLATHDYFGSGCPRNHEGEEHLTSVYRSSDDGASWFPLTHISNAFWSSLFVNRGAIYLLGCSQQYGSIVIRRSDDGGCTWTHPADETSGLLFQGGSRRRPPNYHCAPVPVLEHEGRLYRAFEDNTPCSWPEGFQALVISADVNADLLDASSWTMSNRVPFDPDWLPQRWHSMTRPGWLEGNVLAGPDGSLHNLMRFNSEPFVDIGALLSLSDDGRRLQFDPDDGFIDFPGGMTKFTIRRDPITGLYITLSNNNTDASYPSQRNVLSLHVSEDLRTWRHCKTLLTDDSSLSHQASIKLTAFQYVDWRFDGDDILYLSRTAYDGAPRYHDANRITFHRLSNYPELIQRH